ncbi:MAG TPA: DegT/DnrJ/EryC1/StrS family aminotransferase [Longilinea sp.]|nr:DegT/DnrJ/EryC1/StrS family aminotransferase [Longilinea sp.]
MANLKVLGGKPLRSEPYPAWPAHDERDSRAVTGVIESGQWGGIPYPGSKAKAFAGQFAAMQGGIFAVPLSNGAAALEVALRAANIGWEDEIIIPAYAFQSIPVAALAAGAIPVIVDIDPGTYCIDPEQVRLALTPKTRAIIVAHLGAQMTDMDAIMEIADSRGLFVIEDCSQVPGAKWHEQGAGTIGHFGAFDFGPGAILTTGEGGMLLCRTRDLAERAAGIVDCGRPKDAAQSNFTLGTNYRLSELQAALGLVALERFPEQVKLRAENVASLEEGLSKLPGVRLLRHDIRHTARSFHRYILAIDPQTFGAEHNVVCFALAGEGIPCDPGYPAMHHYDLFQPWLSRLPVPGAFPERFQFEKLHFPEAERASEDEAVWLDEAIFRAGKQGIDDAVEALKKLLDNRSEMQQLEEMRMKLFGLR